MKKNISHITEELMVDYLENNLSNQDKKKFEELLLKISKKDEYYVLKKENLKKLNYQNTWNNVNQNLLETLNEN